MARGYSTCYLKKRRITMAKVFDISSRITNELPCLKITDEIVVTINNRTKTVLCVQALARENEEKEDKEKKLSEDELIIKALEILIGKKKTSEIQELDLPITEFKAIYSAIMEIAITGEFSDTPSTD